MNKRKLLVLAAFGAGLWSLITGFCDLDWMINCYFWNMENGSQGVWWFNTYISMEWWNAYMLTVARIIFGSALLGGIAERLLRSSPK